MSDNPKLIGSLGMNRSELSEEVKSWVTRKYLRNYHRWQEADEGLGLAHKQSVCGKTSSIQIKSKDYIIGLHQYRIFVNFLYSGINSWLWNVLKLKEAKWKIFRNPQLCFLQVLCKFKIWQAKEFTKWDDVKRPGLPNCPWAMNLLGEAYSSCLRRVVSNKSNKPL